MINFGEGCVLPGGVFTHLATWMGRKDLLKMTAVCKSWREHILSQHFQNHYITYHASRYAATPLQYVMKREGIFGLEQKLSMIDHMIKDWPLRSFQHWYWKRPGQAVDTRFDINGRNHPGRTALHFAAFDEDVEKCRFLLEHGADVNVADKEGYTPLMFARKIPTVELLLDWGAQVNDENKEGQTALTQALENRDYAASSLLVQRGGTGSVESVDLLDVIQHGDDLLGEYCVRQGVSADEGAYHLALQMGNRRTAQALVAAGVVAPPSKNRKISD